MRQPRLSRLQEHVPNQQVDRLYDPLRKSLFKTSTSATNHPLSSSQLSSFRYLDNSRIDCNNMANSRVSRRVRQLTPEQAQRIKNSIFIPSNKKLIPTGNLDLIRNKRFEAISVEERRFNPIKSLPSKSRIQSSSSLDDSVQRIVYATQDGGASEPLNIHYYPPDKSTKTTHSQALPVLYNTSSRYSVNQGRILNKNDTSIYNSNYGIGSKKRIPESKNIYYFNQTKSPSSTSIASPTPVVFQKPIMNTSTLSTARFDSHYTQPYPAHQTRFSTNYQQQSSRPSTAVFYRNSSPSPPPPSPTVVVSKSPPIHAPISRTSFDMRSSNLKNISTVVAPPSANIYTSGMAQQQSPRLTTQTRGVGAYDFRKSDASTSIEEYNSKKKEDFKYNLFSLIDEPANTKCKGKGCLNNEIIASQPKEHDWDQQSYDTA